MVLSQAQIDEIASNFHEKFVKFLALRDPLKVAACYEPNAVLMQSGKENKAWFGRERKDKLTQSLATPNGEYVILQGIVEEGGDWKPYEVVLRKQSDGSYLITRDEFNV